MQHVPAADGVARDHGDHRLRQRADLALQIEHVEARHAVVADVAPVAAHALVAAGAEGVGSLAGEDDDADLRVLARGGERVRQLDQRLRPEGVAHLGPVDGDLGDAVRGLVADVGVGARRTPVGRHGCLLQAERKASTAAVNAAGFSRWVVWPASGTTHTVGCGRRSAIACATATYCASSAPAISSVGTATSPRTSQSGAWRPTLRRAQRRREPGRGHWRGAARATRATVAGGRRRCDCEERLRHPAVDERLEAVALDRRGERVVVGGPRGARGGVGDAGASRSPAPGGAPAPDAGARRAARPGRRASSRASRRPARRADRARRRGHRPSREVAIGAAAATPRGPGRSTATTRRVREGERRPRRRPMPVNPCSSDQRRPRAAHLGGERHGRPPSAARAAAHARPCAARLVARSKPRETTVVRGAASASRHGRREGRRHR